MMFLCVPTIFFKDEDQIWQEMKRNANIIDNISMNGFSIVTLITWPICPLLIAKAIPSAPLLIMNRDLKWPKNGLAFVISFILILQLPCLAEEVPVRIKHIWFKVQLPH